MRPYAEVIGNPIAHSKSPLLHRFWLQALRIDADYHATRVTAAELGGFLNERRRDKAWRGCSITAPLKERALLLVDELTERARQIGAVNLIFPQCSRLIGDNSDIDGIAEAVPAEAIRGQPAVVIGAGGAARPAVHHLATNGATKIHILARTPRRALDTAAQYAGHCPILLWDLQAQGLSQVSVLINASPLGMSHAPMPAHLVDLATSLNDQAFVFDMVYDPLETPLLGACKRARLRTADGLTMLVGQARTAFQSFFGKAPPPGLDLMLKVQLRQGVEGAPRFEPV